MKRKLIVFSLAAVMMSGFVFGGLTTTVDAKQKDSNTDWMSGTYGIFLHYLNGSSMDTTARNKAQWDGVVNSFDVNGFANEVELMGAKYVYLSIGQNDGFICAPNATYNSFHPEADGTKPNTSSDRDLPMELANALNAKGIKLMLYFTSSVPAASHREGLARNLGATTKVGDWVINDTVSTNWAKVIQEFADRYGSKIAGWWFDGAYSHVNFNEAVAKKYDAAVKHGNPKAIVCFNQGEGIIDTRYECESYTAGEFNKLPTKTPTRWTSKNMQWHEFTFLGPWWGDKGTQFKTGELTERVKKVVEAGGAITFDMAIKGNGSFRDPAQVLQMMQVKRAVGVDSGNSKSGTSAKSSSTTPASSTATNTSQQTTSKNSNTNSSKISGSSSKKNSTDTGSESSAEESNDSDDSNMSSDEEAISTNTRKNTDSSSVSANGGNGKESSNVLLIVVVILAAAALGAGVFAFICKKKKLLFFK